MKLNPEFMDRLKAVAKRDEPVFVMCRSGGRSPMAVNAMAEAGYTNAYNIVDGMEGDNVGDADSVLHGQRLRSRWKNSGIPSTCEPNPERMRLSTVR
jgi:hypothetical protein